jgi:vancomycin resistance protein YoaR
MFTFVLTLSALVVFGAAFAIGYARMNEGRVLPGVTVGGVDIAGLSRSAAEGKLRQSLPNLSSGALSVDIGGRTETIPYAEFGRDYDFELMLDQAFSVGRGDTFLHQLREQVGILLNGVSLEPHMTWDNDVLATRVAAVAVAAQVPAVNASVERVDGRYAVTPASEGVAVDVTQAVEKAMAAVNNLSAASTQITVEGVPVPPTVNTDQAQAAADRAEAVVGTALPLAGEELATTINPDVLRGWVSLNQVALGDWQLSIPPEPVAQWLATYAASTNVAPTNASFGFEGGEVTVVQSAVGRALDVDATTANVVAALNERANGANPTTVNLALAPVEPEFTTTQAQELASRVTLLGEWTTRYDPGPLNGNGVNIEIPTRTIDGMVAQPGETFDFITAIGEVTSPPYVEGGILIHGQIKEDGAIGGGMCSCSTTLFNAIMRAGFQVDQRTNHSIYISRYPVGLDATIWESGRQRVTMAFTNDTQYPILIKGINAPGKVTFEVYGIDDGRTVELSEPIIENVRPAETWLEYSDDLPPGERRRSQEGYDAFDSSVTRIVRDAAGNVIHQDTWLSHYRKLDEIVEVGRYPTDPPPGTQIRPEEYPGAAPPPPPVP